MVSCHKCELILRKPKSTVNFPYLMYQTIGSINNCGEYSNPIPAIASGNSGVISFGALNGVSVGGGTGVLLGGGTGVFVGCGTGVSVAGGIGVLVGG
jgi:hypothetical protein